MSGSREAREVKRFVHLLADFVTDIGFSSLSIQQTGDGRVGIEAAGAVNALRLRAATLFLSDHVVAQDDEDEDDGFLEFGVPSGPPLGASMADNSRHLEDDEEGIVDAVLKEKLKKMSEETGFGELWAEIGDSAEPCLRCATAYAAGWHEGFESQDTLPA